MKYYIITEIERQSTWYDTMENAITTAEQTLPASMTWEIREEDEEVGTEEVVYTHYVEDEELR